MATRTGEWHLCPSERQLLTMALKALTALVRYNNPAGGGTALHAVAKSESRDAATVISLLLNAGASPETVTLPVGDTLHRGDHAIVVCPSEASMPSVSIP